MEEKKIPTADELIRAINDYKTVQKNLKTVRDALVKCERESSYRCSLEAIDLMDLGETYMKLKGAEELLLKESNRIWMAHEEFFTTNPIDFTA